MKESSLWVIIRQNLPQVHWQRIETSTGLGIPDINGCWEGKEFWVEIKYLPTFPVRANTPVKIKHYTPEQRLWLRKRGQAGGQAWLFVRVGAEWFLFDHEAAQLVTGWTAEQWRTGATLYWTRRPDWVGWLEMVVGKI